MELVVAADGAARCEGTTSPVEPQDSGFEWRRLLRSPTALILSPASIPRLKLGLVDGHNQREDGKQECPEQVAGDERQCRRGGGR